MAQADMEQMAGEVVQLGVIVSVDLADATCTVEIGDLTTGDLPWLAARAGAVVAWSPPTVGEQCLVLAPEGDLANALVLLGLYSDAHPAPSASPDLVQLLFADGASICYDQQAHQLAVTLPAGATATIDAPGGATWNGDLTLNGKLTVNDDVAVNGELTASDDVKTGGISLKTHKHTGVASGSAQSGPPA
jgi:phage baseplate assembly protein V